MQVGNSNSEIGEDSSSLMVVEGGEGIGREAGQSKMEDDVGEPEEREGDQRVKVELVFWRRVGWRVSLAGLGRRREKLEVFPDG